MHANSAKSQVALVGLLLLSTAGNTPLVGGQQAVGLPVAPQPGTPATPGRPAGTFGPTDVGSVGDVGKRIVRRLTRDDSVRSHFD